MSSCTFQRGTEGDTPIHHYARECSGARTPKCFMLMFIFYTNVLRTTGDPARILTSKKRSVLYNHLQFYSAHNILFRREMTFLTANNTKQDLVVFCTRIRKVHNASRPTKTNSCFAISCSPPPTHTPLTCLLYDDSLRCEPLPVTTPQTRHNNPLSTRETIIGCGWNKTKRPTSARTSNPLQATSVSLAKNARFISQGVKRVCTHAASGEQKSNQRQACRTLRSMTCAAILTAVT